MIDSTKNIATGHIIIKDKHTGEILVDKDNAIHNGNISYAIAKALAGDSSGFIKYMAFGNGGTQIDVTGNIAYKPANVSNILDETAGLYSPSKVEISPGVFEDFRKDVTQLNDTNNFITTNTAGQNYADVVVTVTLTFGEPAGQDLTDGGTGTAAFDGEFVFDEIGLIEAGGNLLTHVIFHPVKKSSNREIEIEYTLRIQVS